MNQVTVEKGCLQRQSSHGWQMLMCLFMAGIVIMGCQDHKPKIYRVGVVCGADLFLPVIDGMKSKMTELGFVEGQNIIYEVHTFNDDSAGEQEAAEKLVANKVDLIITVPTQPSVMAHRSVQGTDIPLVFAYAGIEGNGLVQSVPHPGGNVTGVRFPGPEQTCKRLEILQTLLPKAKRVWIGYDENYPTVELSLKALRPLAASMDIKLIETPVTTSEELKQDLAKRAQETDPGMDAIILMPDTLNHSSAGWGAICSFAEKHRIPIGGSFYYTAEQGALYATGNEMETVGELTAPLAAKVLNGTPAGTIPVVSPEQVFIINHGVARDLGIALSEGVLSMASRIIR